MNDQAFKIDIISTADNSGFESTAAAAKDLNASMGVINVSQEEVNKALGKGGAAAEHNQRQMRLLAHALGSDVPGGAALLESALESLQGTEGAAMGATFLLVGGLELLRNALEKMAEERKEAEKNVQALSEADAKQTEAIEKQREAMEEAEVAEENFHHNLVRNTRDSITAAAELAQALLKARLTAFGEQGDSQKNIAEKEVDDMERRSVVSHATAVKMKEQIDLAYHQQKVAMLMLEDRLEMQILQNQLGNKQIALQTDTGSEATAAGKYQTAIGAKTANATRIEEAQAAIEAANERKKELQASGVTEENVEKLRKSFEEVSGRSGKTTPLEEQFNYLSRHFGGIAPRKLFGSDGDLHLAAYDGADIDISGNKKIIRQLQGKQPDLELNAANAKSDLDAAQNKLQRDRQDVLELQDKIGTTKQTNAIKEGGALQGFGLDQAGSSLTDARGIADRINRGGPASGDEQQRLIQIASQIAGHSVNLQTAVQIIENGANNINVFMAQVGRLTAIFSKLNPTQIAKMEAQINALERQVGAQARSQ